MTEEKEQSIIDKMKESFKDKSDSEMIQLLEQTVQAYEVLGGDWLYHIMQKSIIKNELTRRGIKMKSASS